MRKILKASLIAAVALSATVATPAATPPLPSTDAEIAALKKEIAELKKSAYHPELGEQMLTLQIRHARLWFAGQAQNWTLAAFELQEIKEAFDAVVEQNAEHGMLGVTMSAATGLLIGELVTGQAPTIDLAPFSPARFNL